MLSRNHEKKKAMKVYDIFKEERVVTTFRE